MLHDWGHAELRVEEGGILAMVAQLVRGVRYAHEELRRGRLSFVDVSQERCRCSEQAANREVLLI
jgi:hypothetical protein